jgi:flagellar hook protein FlgE
MENGASTQQNRLFGCERAWPCEEHAILVALPCGNNIMSISALGAGLSGMIANQQALDVEAHNVANMNTAGFQPQGVAFKESGPNGGVTLSAEGRGMAAAEGTDIAASLTSSMMYEAGFKLSAKVVQAADERLGMLIDIRA